jgi:hypothetical protein
MQSGPAHFSALARHIRDSQPLIRSGNGRFADPLQCAREFDRGSQARSARRTPRPTNWSGRKPEGPGGSKRRYQPECGERSQQVNGPVGERHYAQALAADTKRKHLGVY